MAASRAAPLDALARGYNMLIVTLPALASVMIVTIFIIIVTDVTMRMAGLDPPPFTTAYVEYALLYFALFAAPYLTRQKAHVFINALTSRLPEAARKGLARVVYAVASAACLLAAYVSVDLLVDAIASGFTDERGVYVPLWLLYAPMPLSFLLVALEFGRFLLGFDDMYSSDSYQDNI